jgi:O-succinylbenzoate synthase
MKLEKVDLYHIELPLVHPFETSFGRETHRPCILVALYAEGITGWGECTAAAGPWYSYETIETAWHMLRDFLVPALLTTYGRQGKPLASPDEAAWCFERVRGHPMARAALESSVWDLVAQARGLSLAALLHGERERVEVGVSIGIEPTLEALLCQIDGYVEQGYQRIKLKIKPGWDVAVVRRVRERWPELRVQVDANCAYTPADEAVFRELDELQLLLIEQPFSHDDLTDHARLQAALRTPICLDESITSLHQARQALDLGACRVINIKVGRVGGPGAARAIHDLCYERGVPVWCGGMLETNIGRALNVALASLPNFILPGDISSSARYYQQDIAEPGFTLQEGSTLAVPRGPGLGVQVVHSRLEATCLRRLELWQRWSR